MRYKFISVFFLLSVFLLTLTSVSFAQAFGSEAAQARRDVEGTLSADNQQAVIPTVVSKEIKGIKSNFQSVVMQKRTEASEAAVLKRNQFKNKLKIFKDQNKAQSAEKIDVKILSLNSQRTDKLADVLDKLQSILDRIVTKGNTEKTLGKDTALLDAAVVNATTAISDAQILLTAQAEKQYVINATDEASLKVNVGSVVSTFRIDLASVHKSVIDAKQAVRRAATELAKLAGAGGINPVSTSSAAEGVNQ